MLKKLLITGGIAFVDYVVNEVRKQGENYDSIIIRRFYSFSY